VFSLLFNDSKGVNEGFRWFVAHDLRRSTVKRRGAAVFNGQHPHGASSHARSGGQSSWSASLEVESHLNRKGSRRHVMGPTESGNEVVQRLFVRQVDR